MIKNQKQVLFSKASSEPSATVKQKPIKKTTKKANNFGSKNKPNQKDCLPCRRKRKQQ